MLDDGAALVRDFLAGDAAAAARVQSWVRVAASPFRRRLGDDWHDAVQESLLEIAEGLRGDRLRDPRRVRAWVSRATAYTCLDRLRARRRWSWVDVEEVPLSRPPSALARLLASDDVRALVRLAGRCPERCRRLWAMILEGLSYREMSRRTGITEGALRVRVLRCRRHAQALAERDLGERGRVDGVRDETKSSPGRQDGVSEEDHAV